MRKLLFTAASCAALMSASSASAAELLFDFVGLDAADNFNFTLDSNPTPDVSGGFGFEITSLEITTSTGVLDTTANFIFEANGGGLNFNNFNPDLGGPQLFTGAAENPTFLTGVFDLNFFSTGADAGTLTISPTAGAVPEPGTWLLMILGFGAIGASLRRRKQPAKLSVSYS